MVLFIYLFICHFVFGSKSKTGANKVSLHQIAIESWLPAVFITLMCVIITERLTISQLLFT